MKRGNKKLFGRESIQRAAFIRSLATALIEQGRIQTTVIRAKTVSSHIERLITRAKKGDLASRRLLLQYVGAKATHKLIGEIAPLYIERHGGYTKITKLNRRPSDGSAMAILELIK